MKNIIRAVCILAVALILLVAVFAASGFPSDSPHVWPSVNETVSYSGRQSLGSQVYVGPGELALIDLRNEDDGLYVVNTATQSIGIPNESNFFIAFGYAYSKQAPPPLAPMSKAETVPDLRIQPYEVEFTSVKKARVYVTWHLNK
jgi:hypothetical protein